MSYNYLKSVRKVVCIGRNYAAHIKEFNNPTPKQPFFFLKPTTSLITPLPDAKSEPTDSDATFKGFNEDGTNPSPVYIPGNVTVHHEVELALIMKNNLSNIEPSEFTQKDLLDNISGFALAFDLTARNVQSDAKKNGLPWFFAKGFDTFCPISHMIPVTDIPDLMTTDMEKLPKRFRLKCYVNDELRQDDHCGMMLNPWNKVVSNIAKCITLETGDLVLTGTPSGVGPVEVGDILRGQLFVDDKLLIDMKFDCQSRPGDYHYVPS